MNYGLKIGMVDVFEIHHYSNLHFMAMKQANFCAKK